MTSLTELNKSINLLEEKIEELTIKMDLTVNKYVTTTQLEVASAKIISDLSENIEKVSIKIDTCPCNKEILDHIKSLSTTSTSTKPGKYSGLSRYSPPNVSLDDKKSETTKNLIQALIFPKKDK